MASNCQSTQAHIFTDAFGLVISTNSAHRILIAANRFTAQVALTINSSGAVICNTTFTNNSDASLKADVQALDTAQALAVLKAIEPKVYKRTDLQDNVTRAGFIAQDVAAALGGTGWDNIVGATQAIQKHEDPEGNVRPAKPSMLTLVYARLGSTVLWQVCRSLLARMETLETKLAQ